MTTTTTARQFGHLSNQALANELEKVLAGWHEAKCISVDPGRFDFERNNALWVMADCMEAINELRAEMNARFDSYIATMENEA